jgi:tetratricopeptide (TPR) repeat protein
MAENDEGQRRFDDGIDAYRAGEYEEALDALAQAQELFAAEGNPEAQAEALGSQGVVYIELEEWDRAKAALDEALAIIESLPVTPENRSNQGKVLGNLGMMYARQGDEEDAAQAYEAAIAIFQELGERGNEKAVMRQMGKLKLKKGKFLDALGDYQEGLEEGEEASGAQKMARKLFRLLGRTSGGGSLPVEDETEDDEDVIDLTPDIRQE